MDATRAFDPARMKAAAAEYSSSDSGDDDDEYMMPSTDPNADEFADFNPRKRRRTGRDAKESAALGVFGSESEDEGPARRWKRKTLRNKGMSFVSSANDAAKDEENEDVVDKDDHHIPSLRATSVDDEEEDDEDDDTPGIGLGFGKSAGLGNAWAPPGNMSQAQGPDIPKPFKSLGGFRLGGSQSGTGAFRKEGFDSSVPLGKGFVPSSDTQPVLNVDADTPTRPRAAQPSSFSSSKGGKKTRINAGGFAARMMEKMGYKEGQGLGKEGQGRQGVIEANLRPQGAGLGAVKEKTEQERQEEKRQARMRGEVVIDSDEEEKKKKAERKKKKALAGGLRSGLGSASSTPKRQQKPKYMTMDEVKKAAPGLNIPDAFTPILDMTGAGGERKMLTSSSGLMTPTGRTAEEEDEMQSKKLVKRAQNDFMAILEEWQGLQERKAYAELQLRQEQQELEELEKGVASHQLLAGIFDELLRLDQVEDQMLLNGDQAKQRWDRAISLLRQADESTSNLTVQTVRDEMASTAVAALHPILEEMMENWDPLKSPRAEYAADLESIKGLLGIDKPATLVQARASATAYESMMYKLWLPHLSRSVREWNVRDAEPMIAVYEAWHNVLPGFVKTYFLEQDIIRRLDEAISKWEPKRRKQHSLPHLWLFPWLQHLPYQHLDPKSSTGLVADVKRKFRQLIDVWEFDRGVIPGLKEWKKVLRPSQASDQWKPLVMNHVLPGMARYLRKNFRVQPSDQEPYLQVLTGVLEWRHIVSPTMISEVVVAEVFPKWHEILYQWLVDGDVSYEDIAHWCEWWHDADGPLPSDIRDTPSVASEFEKGLHTIERALDLFDLGEDPIGLAPPASGPALAPRKSQQNGHRGHQQHGHHHHHDHEKKHPNHSATPSSEPQKRSFRNVVEDWCQENDVQFIPERKQVHSEGPLYRITARGDGKGGVLAYFKGDKLVLSKNREEFGQDAADFERLMTHVM